MAATRLPLIIHERLGLWARQVRPRIVGWPVWLVETRSPEDLVQAAHGAACPLVLIELTDRPRAGLEDLDRCVQVAPNALVLVLDRAARPGLTWVARELGATHVLQGVTAPPAVIDLLARWLPVAQRRAELDGWEAAVGPALEAWEPLLAGPAARTSAS